MVQVLEAVRAFEAGVLEDIREGDVGAILGWGFAPWSGGPFSWIDMIGAAKAVEICDSLATEGPRFDAPALLKDLATTEEHERWAVASGFSKVEVNDGSVYTKRSLRRLYRLSHLGVPIDYVLHKLLGLRSETQSRNVKAARDQWRSFCQRVAP